ncbi:MAG: glycosyltransferase, partial [Muribaculaceae bacterium]|nr:glycosyltransferase [Muribaculaceae bacterium]
LLRDNFPEVKVIAYPENYGFAEGYNRAIADTNYPYTILLNSDAAPAPGWIEPLYQFMETHPEYAACQPKILSARDNSKFEYAGASGGFIDRNGYPYCRGRIFDIVETDAGQYDTVIDIDWATGAALMVRSQLYTSLGGLDRDFFAHMEEIDLCWRMRRNGQHHIAVIPQSIVYHLGGGSLPVSNPKKTYLNFRNNLLLLHKNLPPAQGRRTLLKRRLLDTIAFAKFALTLDWDNAKAIVRAHNDFRRMRRNYTPASIDGETNPLKQRPNILTKFYLRRRRTFSSL